MIDFLPLKHSYTEIKDEINSAIKRVLESGRYIGGNEVSAFETLWSKYCNSRYCVGCSNGLDSLILTLIALNIKEGDEVIVPAHTFIATWLSVKAVGAKIIPIEPDPDTFNLDISKLIPLISTKTKAIIAVHLYGQPANLTKLKEVAKYFNLYLIEDAAQAHGAKFNGETIGCHSDAVCWSFYPGKNLGAIGDAGAVTTNSFELQENIRKIQNYGSTKKYHHDTFGFNKRLDPIQAAILSVKLSHLDEWNLRRLLIANRYLTEIKNKKITLPKIVPKSTSAWHLFVVKTKNRDLFQNLLREHDIETIIHYPIPPHRQKAFVEYSNHNLPVTENLSTSILSLPISPHHSTDEISKIINVVNSF